MRARAQWAVVVWVLVGVFVGARVAEARAPTGTVSRTVVDESAQVVPGAMITLVHEQTAAARAAVSGHDGTFTFHAVPAGIYTVRVELSGFRTRTGRERGERREPADAREHQARRRHVE